MALDRPPRRSEGKSIFSLFLFFPFVSETYPFGILQMSPSTYIFVATQYISNNLLGSIIGGTWFTVLVVYQRLSRPQRRPYRDHSRLSCAQRRPYRDHSRLSCAQRQPSHAPRWPSHAHGRPSLNDGWPSLAHMHQQNNFGSANEQVLT